MTILAFGQHLLGPYVEVSVGEDRIYCDGLDFPFNAIAPYKLLSSPPPGPLDRWRWDFEERTYAALPPPPRAALVVPKSVSRMQAKQVLLAIGMLEAAEDAIVALGDPLAQLYWKEAADFHRDHPVLVVMTSALGLTEAQMDDLFIQAAQVV